MLKMMKFRDKGCNSRISNMAESSELRNRRQKSQSNMIMNSEIKPRELSFRSSVDQSLKSEVRPRKLSLLTERYNFHQFELESVPKHQVFRESNETIESLTPTRREGHFQFCKVLRTLSISEQIIQRVPLAPNLYASNQTWLEWLWTISCDPFNIPLSRFLALSDSTVVGDTSRTGIVCWRTIRGQEELVHKAVRVVYPKPIYVDLLAQVLLYIFYALCFPGSLVVHFGNTRLSVRYGYIPYCIMWTVAAVINLGLMTSGSIFIWKMDEVRIVMGSFAAGILFVAGYIGIPLFFYNLSRLEQLWPNGLRQSESVQRHFAENRSVAWFFYYIFDVSLPSYTSAHIYPLIYPLMASIPGCVGALIALKLRGDEVEKSYDLFTWIGLIGANIIVFYANMQWVARWVLFWDPILMRTEKTYSG